MMFDGDDSDDSAAAQQVQGPEHTDGDACIEDVEERVYFRVIHTNPSQQHLQERTAAAGQKIHHSKLAVALVPDVVASAGDGGLPLVQTMPDVDRQSVAVLDFLGNDVAWLRQNVRVHKQESQLFYAVDDASVADKVVGSQLIDALFMRGALPGTSNFMPSSAASVEFLQLLGGMVAGGLVRAVRQIEGLELGQDPDTLWQLTHRGMKAIVVGSRMRPGVSAFEPRALALQSLNPFELVVTLLDRGWIWKRLPSSPKARRQLLPYDPQNPGVNRVFYTGNVILPEYVCCLLGGRQSQLVPHGLEPKDYTDLLEGRQLQLAHATGPALKRKRVLMLKDADDDSDVELRGPRRARGRGPGRARGRGHGRGEIPAGPRPVKLHRIRRRLLKKTEPHADDVFEDDWDALFDGKVGEPEPTLEEALGDLIEQCIENTFVQGGPPPAVAPPPPPPPPAPVPPTPQGAAEDWIDERYKWNGFEWYGFRFTLKQAFGQYGWQIRCPYHKGSTQTALQCKKWIPFGVAVTDEGRQLGLRSAKRWSLMFGCARKSLHLKEDPADRALVFPTDASLENHASGLPPPPAFRDVLPDDILDLMHDVDA